MVAWSPGMSLEDIEEKIISKAYEHYNKNLETTAQSLRITVNELNQKISKFTMKQIEIKKTLDKEKKRQEEFNLRARGYNADKPILPQEIGTLDPPHQKNKQSYKHKS